MILGEVPEAQDVTEVELTPLGAATLYRLHFSAEYRRRPRAKASTVPVEAPAVRPTIRFENSGALHSIYRVSLVLAGRPPAIEECWLLEQSHEAETVQRIGLVDGAVVNCAADGAPS